MATTDEIRDLSEAVRDHVSRVCAYLSRFCYMLRMRAESHDMSKLEEPEVQVFAEYRPQLRSSEYASAEYDQFREEMKSALEHHYRHNRHHPEHFPRGMKDMNMIDMVEMLCDWKAASLQHDNGGDIMKSIEKNQVRFGYGDELKEVMKNTAAALFGAKGE